MVDAAAALSSATRSISFTYPEYDVFLSHRGPDVKETLATSLYRILRSLGLKVFLDAPELQPGHKIITQIEAAIRSASVHIAIFSRTYADSKWCLDELVQTLDSRGFFLPVFYDVQPSDLRLTDKNNDGVYARSLRQHEEKQRCDSQTIQKWRKALFDAASISGIELKACNGDKEALLKKVVQIVLKRQLPKYPNALLLKIDELSITELSEEERMHNLITDWGRELAEAEDEMTMNSLWQSRFTLKKGYGKEECEAQWAHTQHTLHGLQTVPESKMFVERQNFSELSGIAEQPKRRAEISRLRELHTLRGQVESLISLKGMDIDTTAQAYSI